jgi:nucleoside-diphosphate-sugar epimerase/CBS domain-containing protein
MATQFRSGLARVTTIEVPRTGEVLHRGAPVRDTDLKWLKVLVSAETTISDTMRVIDHGGVGFALVVDGERRLLGVVSDGDLRKALLAGEDAASPTEVAMTKSPVVITLVDLGQRARLAAVARLLQERQARFVPVLSTDGTLVGVRSIDELERLLHRPPLATRRAEQAVRRTVGSVLVIGGAGYLGSVLTRRLLQAGYQVRAFDRLLFGGRREGESMKDLLAHPDFELVRGDLRHIDEAVAALDGMDACILLAAIVGDPASKANPRETIGTNLVAAQALADACRYQQINRFLYASTCSVYGLGAAVLDETSPLAPVSLYARTKIGSEQGILGLADQNFAPCCLRLSTLYGPSPRMRYDLVLNTFVLKAFTERRIVVKGGQQWRPLLHVRDAAHAFHRALEAPIECVRGQTFNVGSDAQNYRILALGQLVCELLPGVELVIEDGAQDRRDYRVSFGKIERELDFGTQETVETAIREMWDDLAEGRVASPAEPRFYNHLVAY